MAAVDSASWIINIAPEQSLRARTHHGSGFRKVGRLLASAALASAMTDPQIVAMLLSDDGERSRVGR